MSELEKQIKETKIETMKDFRNELWKRLKEDERTCIYCNLLDVVRTISYDIINEEKERK